MKPDTTRYIVLKINVNEAEDAAIRKKCAAVGKSISAAGRDLFRQMQTPAHRRAIRPRREGAKLGPSLSCYFPGRAGGVPLPLRL